MIATWIFPLAIVLSLPYESMHNTRSRRTSFGFSPLRRSGRTLSATLHWLARLRHSFATTLRWVGSPQTALTATSYNFIQTWRAHSQTPLDLEGNPLSTWNDALYVLTCLNQFELIGPDDQPGRYQHFYIPLLYGLLRPTVDPNQDAHSDKEILRQLLSVLAFQLRMLRRRAVIPALASLGVYIVAFVISVSILFIEVGPGAMVAPLVLGLLFNWLLVLVGFTIIDRDPISSERTG